MSTIERISSTHGITNFQKASDKLKLQIYKLTLEEIFITLGQDLQKLPEKYLDNLKEDLHEIINGFYALRTKPIRDVIDVKQIMPKLMESNAYLLSAATTRKEGKVKGVKYYKTLQNCRMLIFEALQLLE